MKLLFLIIFIYGFQACADLIGTWKLTSYIYDGQPLDLPNPDLDLRFVFYKNGVSVLHWFRHNETGFCERRAAYSVEGTTLHQKTNWIHPQNDFSCSADSEMQLGSETFTPFNVDGQTLYLKLSLDDKSFVYVLSLLPDESSLQNRQ